MYSINTMELKLNQFPIHTVIIASTVFTPYMCIPMFSFTNQTNLRAEITMSWITVRSPLWLYHIHANDTQTMCELMSGTCGYWCRGRDGHLQSERSIFRKGSLCAYLLLAFYICAMTPPPPPPLPSLGWCQPNSCKEHAVWSITSKNWSSLGGKYTSTWFHLCCNGKQLRQALLCFRLLMSTLVNFFRPLLLIGKRAISLSQKDKKSKIIII